MKKLNISRMDYIKKWAIVASIIGIIAGIGAIIFFELLMLGTNYFLGAGAGFIVPSPGSEGSIEWSPPKELWKLLAVLTLGGLFSGLIIYRFAPEAEGHGTDAAIKAFHRQNGIIRKRIPLVKMVTSVITISTGGSAGREGPIAHIAAGFGSFIGQLFKLNVHDRRIAVAVGIGAGVGAIFKAPLGGALLATEILYMRDFEKEALIPAVIASIIGFSLFGYVEGFEPVFTSDFSFTWSVSQIPFFFLLGAACALFGTIYIKAFYGTRDIFRNLSMPNYLKPALGAFTVGILAILLVYVFPEENGMAGLGGLSMGYGFIQLALENQIPLKIMFILIISKILMTSLTIGSGGSGGVFAPGIFIGAMVGGFVGAAFNLMFPWLVGPEAIPAFVIIGMMALFGAVSKAYIAVIIMVSEMTNDYTLLFPAMVAIVGSGIFISRDNTIFKEQVETRLKSPAHMDEYFMDLLKAPKVKDIMRTQFPTLDKTNNLKDAILKMQKGFSALPVMEEDRFLGCVRLQLINEISFEEWEEIPAGLVMAREPPVISPDSSLYDAIRMMDRMGAEAAFVVDKDDQSRLLGILLKNDIVKFKKPGDTDEDFFTLGRFDSR